MGDVRTAALAAPSARAREKMGIRDRSSGGSGATSRGDGARPSPSERTNMTDSSTPAGVIVLDAVVFIIGVAILGSAIAWFARKIFWEK